jgi:gamma-glutamyl-gamma-aminobutyrate hydrolase PuuD
MNDKEYTVNSYHRMCISELGKALVPLAWANTSVEAFRHLTRPHWGLVWHPERMADPILPKDLERLING